MSKLKVFGGLTFQNGQQVRTAVAANSQKRAAELVGWSLYEFRQYWSVTHNPDTIGIALSQPETVFVASSSMSDDYKPLTKEI